jgi:hypothetical protein
VVVVGKAMTIKEEGEEFHVVASDIEHLQANKFRHKRFFIFLLFPLYTFWRINLPICLL